jgi:hypothetical protein
VVPYHAGGQHVVDELQKALFDDVRVREEEDDLSLAQLLVELLEVLLELLFSVASRQRDLRTDRQTDRQR